MGIVRMKKQKKITLSNLKIKVPRVSSTKPSNPTADKVKVGEILGGTIQGKRASAPEKVLEAVLNKYQVNFMFRWVVPEVPGHYGLAGDKEVDFLISKGVLMPVQVADFQFIHNTPEQLEKDRQSDIRVNSFFKDYGATPVVWINALDLQNVEMADYKVRQLGIV
jgi:hypothetical protein